MNPASNPDYRRLISELIKKQIIILGPNITIAKAKNVQGLNISSTGEVLGVNRDPKTVFDELSNEFVQLSETIVKKTMESLLQSDQASESEKKEQDQPQAQNDTSHYQSGVDVTSPDQKINPLNASSGSLDTNLSQKKDAEHPNFTQVELEDLNRTLKDEVMDNLAKAKQNKSQ